MHFELIIFLMHPPISLPSDTSLPLRVLRNKSDQTVTNFKGACKELLNACRGALGTVCVREDDVGFLILLMHPIWEKIGSDLSSWMLHIRLYAASKQSLSSH